MIKLLSTELNHHWPIHKKWSDFLFIIFTPIFALVITAIICEPRGTNYVYNESTPLWFIIAASVLTHAHVLVGFSRSHLNSFVFKKYIYRFTLIPVIAIVLMLTVPPILILASAFGLYWDEWHSLMQTFGFGRIYDTKFGNDPLLGRKLDMGMAFMVGLFPNLLLLTMLPKTQIDGALVEYLEMPLKVVKQYAHHLENAQLFLILSGVIFVVFYLFEFKKLIKNGYHYSLPKILLFASTGISTSIIAYKYTIADGVFYGNIYHALQYFYVVYISERKNLGEKMTKLDTNENSKRKMGTLFYFLLIVPLVFVLAGIRQSTQNMQIIGVFWLATSLLHFWFDGFIWSVRRKDI
jgi:hypothetical protein